jgi:tRNA wybutosine-synthesizing protein 1
VSNGTAPSVLAKLSEEPTQLYISVCAPNREIFNRVCQPQIPRAWKKLNDTLELFSSFKSPTVIRITLARGLNMANPAGYAKLIEKANPTYIETKAYMHVGFSRLRLGYESMPDHQEVREFAEQVAKETSYSMIDESPESRIVLLSRLKKSIRFGSG